MIFLEVAGVGLCVAILVGIIGYLFSFWVELSDGAWWGFGGFLLSIALCIGAFAQTLAWAIA